MGHVHLPTRKEIIYTDDGRGLNLRDIKQTAISMELIEEQTNLSDQNLAELIFTSGFSTAPSLTEISGRGVGMDAVKAYLEEKGGSITIDLDKKQQNFSTFRFRIRLPKQLYTVA